jgi:hypothetical protein
MEERVIYCIFSDDSVYIGRTKNIRRRMVQHRHPPFWAILEKVKGGFHQACDREESWVGYFREQGIRVLNKYWPRRCPDRSSRPLKQYEWLKAAIKKHGDSKECLLWPFSTCGKYGQVPIGGGRADYAHRVAWKLKHPGEIIPEGMKIMHDKHCVSELCFNPNNLTLGTHQQNMDTAKELGHMQGPGKGATAGEKNGRAVLSQSEVTKIRQLNAEGWSERKLAKRFGVGRTTIQRIVKGETWTHLLPKAGAA